MSHRLVWLAFVPALCAPLCAHPEEKLLVQVPATLDPSAPIVESVKRDCKVEALIGNHVFAKVSGRMPETGQLADPAQAGSARVLKLTIVGVMGAGGGAWSGSKAITIRADLSQNAKVFATRTLSRQSGGGVFGGMKGTCSIMERIAVALGDDVAAWLPGALSSAPAPAPAKEEPAAPAPAADKPAAESKQ